jgi:hypothetical protein
MSHYQRIIRQLHPSVNPAGVEASMRLQYGTLSHLSDADFKREIRIAIACERDSPGFLRRIAESFGMGDDFQQWEG